MGTLFKDKEELAQFIQNNMPFCVKPTRKAKTTFVQTFTSSNGMKAVIEHLTDKIWEKINE